MEELSSAMARNRAEEISPDQWSNFVVPPFFDRLEYGRQLKPIQFVGGRGCGKTTLLRYLSHRTQFSPFRPFLDAATFKNIGFYYRADTQYLSAFRGAGLEDRIWQSMFRHAVCLAVAEELLDCFNRVCTWPKAKRSDDLAAFPKRLIFHQVKDYDESLPVDLPDLLEEVGSRRRRLMTWINNTDTMEKPRALPLVEFLQSLIEHAREQAPCFAKSTFHVLIDEYENLLGGQQRIVNTLLKHSTPPLVFHIAIKRYGMRDPRTLSEESLQESEDHRTIDLEERLKKNFPLFCAELMFQRLIQKGYPEERTPIKVEELRSVSGLKKRFDNEEYKQEVLQAIKRILPETTPKQVASLVFKDDALLGSLRKLLERGLARKQANKLTPKDFLVRNQPEASVVCAALLHQEGKQPLEIHRELQLLLKGERSKFKEGDWIHHYLNGVLFLIYLRLQRPCLLYSGFDAFIKLAYYNIRHFLELTHIAIKDSPVQKPEHLKIAPEVQTEAAKEGSALFLNEISGSGISGNRLYRVAQTLGQIFRLSQGRASQSEPERTHFTIVRGDVKSDAKAVLEEGVKWSVLLEEQETKVKNPRYKLKEYRLNPIYAPFFGISYNKGRKIELTSDQAEKVLTGSSDTVEEVIKSFESSFSPEKNMGPKLVGFDDATEDDVLL